MAKRTLKKWIYSPPKPQPPLIPAPLIPTPLIPTPLIPAPLKALNWLNRFSSLPLSNRLQQINALITDLTSIQNGGVAISAFALATLRHHRMQSHPTSKPNLPA